MSDVMCYEYVKRVSRPAVATGVARVSAGLTAVTPTTTAPPDIQHRLVQLTTVGAINLPEVDWNDFAANTTAHCNGLTEMFDHAIATLPLDWPNLAAESLQNLSTA